MKKEQDKSKKKKKQIDWEKQLFQVASQFLASNMENHMIKAKTFIKQYRKLYEMGEFDDVIT